MFGFFSEKKAPSPLCSLSRTWGVLHMKELDEPGSAPEQSRCCLSCFGGLAQPSGYSRVFAIGAVQYISYLPVVPVLPREPAEQVLYRMDMFFLHRRDASFGDP